jgi:hypothetical protein
MRIRNTGKKSRNTINQRFSYYFWLFCLMIEGSGAGFVLVTNGSGCGSGRPKNIRIRIQMRIRIQNTAGYRGCWCLPLHGLEDLGEEGGDAGEKRQVDLFLRLEDRDEPDQSLGQPLHTVHPATDRKRY